MIIARFFILLTIFFINFAVKASLDVQSLTTDNRIKTYIYSPNEVFLLVLHYGFQSNIEFAKGEEIKTITLGDTFAWKITPLENRLFVRAMEKNIRTKMTVITNKRTYEFDIVAKELDEGEEKDLVYVIRFYYPENKRRTVRRDVRQYD